MVVVVVVVVSGGGGCECFPSLIVCNSSTVSKQGGCEVSVMTIRSCTGEKLYVPRKSTQAWTKNKQTHLNRFFKTSVEILKSQKAVGFPFSFLFSCV